MTVPGKANPGWKAIALLTLAMLAGEGCSNLDDFSWRKMNFEVFRDPKEPIAAIRTSTDGSLRRRALLCVQEPLANGGSQKEQDEVVALLSYTAAHDTQAPCRMAAIATMRKFRDPRIVDGLKEAYYRAGSLSPDSATVVRMLALGALGDTGSPGAVETLVRVLREPPTEGPEVDRQQKLTERIAAARALGKYKQYQATSALVEVLQKDDDVALRTRAHESLVEATGKNLPADGQAWAEFLNDPKSKEAIAREPTLRDRVLQLTGMKGE